MVKVSYEQKPFRRSLMHVWGSEVVASPSDETEAGRKVLSEHPDSPGQPRHRDLGSGRGCGRP